MPKQQIKFDKGLVTARDPSALVDGELQVATGCEYRVGTKHLFKQPGRALKKAALGAKILALHKLQYDNARDVLIAAVGGAVYESQVSKDPWFATAALTDLDSTAVPQFIAYNDRWIMCNGVNANYIREPGSIPVKGWATGPWRTLGMRPPSDREMAASTAGASAANQLPDDSTAHVFLYNPPLDDNPNRPWSNTINAYDGDFDTYSYAEILGIDLPLIIDRSVPDTNLKFIGIGQETFTFNTGGAHESTTARELRIIYEGLADYDEVRPELNAWLDLSVSENANDNNPDYVSIGRHAFPFAKDTLVYAITDGVLLSDVAIRARARVGWEFLLPQDPNFLARDAYDFVSARIYDIYVGTGGATSNFSTANSIYYGYTERYTDSDNVTHESVMNTPVELEAFSNQSHAVLTLPATLRNTFANEFVIYRSLDEEGGGFPNMYQIQTISAAGTRVASLQFIDTFERSLTLAADKVKIYDTLSALFPNGAVLQFSLNTPPPVAKMCVEFQGSMVYVPVSGRKLAYSVPATISAQGMEQVPAPFYLTFVTGRNDEIISILKTSGGRALMVYFEQYTMLVRSLPQASDPGVFDTRAVEYVSNQRGTAGRMTVAELTLPTGRTLAASVDSLGLWVTDGVSTVAEWSRDLDWHAAFSGVNLSIMELVNNPEMRRLELLYEDADAQHWEYHFFYGRFKKDGDGHTAALITGPHKMGVRCKHYNKLDGEWIGWSGDANAIGHVYVERVGTKDSAFGYDETGAIPFVAQSGDVYNGGLGNASLIEFGYPKFRTGLNKTVELQGMFVRDGASNARLKIKQFSTATKKVYWHAYADRHSLEVRDINATAMPALVGYQYEVRDAGVGRDK